MNRQLAVATCLVGFALVSQTRAQPTLAGSGLPQLKPAKVDSYIITADGKYLLDGETPYLGTNLPKTLNTFPGPTVDVLMQQCFGGGFAPGMQAAISKYTFTSASHWNELANNAESPAQGLRNFTHSWINTFSRGESLYLRYQEAVNGAAEDLPRPAVPPDPYGPSGPLRTIGRFENPVFASPDALSGGKISPSGPNNSHDVIATNGYALLMAPSNLTEGVDTPRFRANIDRVYFRLVGAGFEPNHIIVLYGDDAANHNNLAGAPVNGPATLANIINAAKLGTGLYGNVDGQTAPANPDANSHLFVYTTGHGDSWTASGGFAKATVAVNETHVNVDVSDMPANAFLDNDGSDSGIGTIDLQITSTAADLIGGLVSLNGTPIGSLLSDPIPQNPLDDILGTSPYYYHLPVSLSQFDSLTSPGAPLQLQFDHLPLANAVDTLFSSISFNNAGDNWAVGVVAVPEPAPGMLLLVVCFVYRRNKK